MPLRTGRNETPEIDKESEAGREDTVPNPFAKDSFVFVDISVSGGAVGFSETAEYSDEYIVASTMSQQNYQTLVKCPDPAIYPYICFKNARDRVIEFKIYNAKTWTEEDGAIAGVARSGLFENVPDAEEIYVGFKYFCTDKQTTEGATDGIEIIHKGNNVWVDALGRVVE